MTTQTKSCMRQKHSDFFNFPDQPLQWFRVHPTGVVVGARHDDHCGVRWHGAQDLPGHVRGRDVRHGRRACGGAACPRDRLQLRHVLQSHPGQGQAAQEEEEGDHTGPAGPPGQDTRQAELQPRPQQQQQRSDAETFSVQKKKIEILIPISISF